MNDIELEIGEIILLKETQVSHNQYTYNTCDLYLTNKNLICVNKGIFGKIKEVDYIALVDISNYGGNLQARMGKSNGKKVLEVCLTYGETHIFGFESGTKKKIERLISAINSVINYEKTGEKIFIQDQTNSTATGSKVAHKLSANEQMEAIQKLQDLFELGVLTDKELERKKKKVMNL